MASPVFAPSLASLGSAAGALAERHIDAVFRRVLRGDCVTAERRFVRVLTGSEHPFGNFALVPAAADPAWIEDAVEPLRRAELPAALLSAGPVLESAGQWLASAGFHAIAAAPTMPAMAVDIDSLPASPLPDGCELESVGGGDDGAGWKEAFAAGYGVPPAVAALFAPGAVAADIDAEPLGFLAIRRAGTIVSTAAFAGHDGVAGVYCVSTRPEARGIGLGGHVTVAALRAAHGHGYRVGVLQSSAEGHSLYRRLGFRDVGAVPLFVRMPGGAAARPQAARGGQFEIASFTFREDS